MNKDPQKTKQERESKLNPIINQIIAMLRAEGLSVKDVRFVVSAVEHEVNVAVDEFEFGYKPQGDPMVGFRDKVVEVLKIMSRESLELYLAKSTEKTSELEAKRKITQENIDNLPIRRILPLVHTCEIGNEFFGREEVIERMVVRNGVLKEVKLTAEFGENRELCEEILKINEGPATVLVIKGDMSKHFWC